MHKTNIRTICAALFTVICILEAGCTSSSLEAPVVTKTLVITNGQITIEPMKWVSYTVQVTPQMIDPTLKGNFTASGGSGDDVTAAVADEMNITNWINEHAATPVWQTPGKLTKGAFEVKLSPGVYYFVISNKFSFINEKKVTAHATLSYGQRGN
jgi:hypothetical protein